MTWTPWRFMMVAIAGWMNRQQQEAIQYLQTENRILREKLGHKRILLSDAQKRRLAAAAAKLPRALLSQVGTLFSPETILKWHRELIARKYDGSERRGKRGPAPTKQRMIRELVIRMAKDNPGWGYGRMHGELRKLGFDVHWQTVRRVMLDLGLLDDPYQPPKQSWKTFLSSHWESMAATDFFSVEAWTKAGLTRFLVMFVIDVPTRRVTIAGIHHTPNEEHMVQWARNLSAEDGFLAGKRCLIHDRDPLFTRRWRNTLKAAGVRCLKIPKRSPNLNAYAESFVRTIKRECLDKMILFGQRHARYVIDQYVEHYNKERPHKGLGYLRPVEPDDEPPWRDGPVLCKERLGGLLKSYYRQAA